MHNIGPRIESLIHRLVETPPDFLEEPRIANTGQVFVAAVVNDLLLSLGGRAPAAALARFQSGDAGVDRNRLAVVLICTWLLADEWFIAAALPQQAVLLLLDQTAEELSRVTPAQSFVTDPDRREELARVVLWSLGYRPEAETIAQATDRLSELSGTERRRLIEASRRAEQRAQSIREALAKKAAEESADKFTRE
ncbi:MAG: hypothetical protein ABI205_10220 [Gemmatimonadaceae bacterium]